MPVVSEHPRSIDVIRRLAEQGNAELGTFVTSYTARRKAYEAEVAERERRIRRLEDGVDEDMSWRELVAILEERETEVLQLRTELHLMDKELVLLRREVRKARRKLIEATTLDDTGYYPDYESPGVPQMASIQDHISRVRGSSALNWLKPWLRSFLPDSA